MEFKFSEESDISGPNVLQKFKTALIEDLKVSFPDFIDSLEVIDLDSSTSEKFSHHLIINFMTCKKEPVYFTNNRNVGNYVRKFCEKVQNLVILPSGKSFVDEAVYSKNRNFRTLLSSKYGRKATLKSENAQDDNKKDFFFKVLN